MNNYYIDPSVSVTGTGTLASPFKSLNDFFSLTSVTHPLTVSIKCGTVMMGNFIDTNNLMYNQGTDMSYITSYGIGARPLLIQDVSSSNVYGVYKARKLTTRGLHFVSPMSATMVGIKPSNMAGTGLSDVWIENCKFSGEAAVMPKIDQYCMYLSVNTDNGAVNNYGFRDCHFDNLPRGVWVIGNSNVPNGQVGNIGDRFYSKGVIAERNTFTRVGADGIIFSNIASDNNPLDISSRNTMTSRITDCYYSSYRLDGQGVWSVAFWMSNCNKVLIEKTTVVSMWPATTDRTAFDFDIYCWDCLIENCYSAGNGGGLFITSNFAGQVTPKPDTGYTNTDWYVTNRYGNGNNTIRNCISYNDGVNLRKTFYQGFIYNLNIINCTFIDLLSTNGAITTVYNESNTFDGGNTGTASGFNFNSCDFYYGNITSFLVKSAGSNAGTDWLARFKNCNIYANGQVVAIPTDSDSGGNISVVSGYQLLPKSKPSSIAQAAQIRLKANSPLIGKGAQTTGPDYFGNLGNTIGWLQ